MEDLIPRRNAQNAAIMMALGAFVVGLIIGLPVLGWWLWPVEWTDLPQPATVAPYPTYTPYPTPTLSPTAVPGPGAYVLGASINLFDGPDASYPILAQANFKEPLVVLGQTASCAWLKVISQSLVTGWISNDGSSVLLVRPCGEISPGTYRPMTRVLKFPALTGSGQFTIKNQGLADVVVALVDADRPGEAIAAAYVRFGETFTISGIPDGKYDRYIAYGSGWSDDGQNFTLNLVVRKASSVAEFVTTQSDYTVWTMTLNPLEGGNTTLVPVSAQQFPDIPK